MVDNTYYEIIRKLQTERFVIYGAGGHASKFLNAIERIGALQNYICNAVTKKNNEISPSVKLIEEVPRDCFVVVAAHYKNAICMEQNLNRLGFSNYVSIYPYFIDLVVGLPYKKDVQLDVNSFLVNCLWGEYLSVIYLAIDDIIHKRDGVGERAYIKIMSYYSASETARGRHDDLKQRVNCYLTRKISENFNVRINLNENFIIDGSHRIVLAKYFGIEFLKADLYNISIEQFGKIFWQGKNTSEQIMQLFSGEEQRIIKQAKKDFMIGCHK